MTWSAGTGISIMNWSGKSTVSGQTGWRLQWKKTTDSTYRNSADFSLSTRTANVCMSYTGSEEDYQISTLVGGTVGNTYSNTWTYTGKIYTDPTLGSTPTCINSGEKMVSVSFNVNKPAGSTSTGSMTGVSNIATTYYTLPANTFTISSPSGYSFKSWNTAAAGTGTTYSDQATLDFTSYANNSTVTLYAQWLLNPSITSLTPNSGSTAGGTSITITGTAFAAGATVTVGGASCTSVVVVSATSITCTTPVGTSGAKDVVVTNTDTGSGTKTNGFTYNAPISAPTISTVSPTSGTAAGGTSITITGTGFVSGAAVTIGGVACTLVVVVSSTTITCTNAAGTAGDKNVVVTNSDSGSVTKNDGFKNLEVVVNSGGGNAPTYTPSVQQPELNKKSEDSKSAKNSSPAKVEVKAIVNEPEKIVLKTNQIVPIKQVVEVKLPENISSTIVEVNGKEIKASINSSGQISLPVIVGPKDKVSVNVLTTVGEKLSAEVPVQISPIKIGNVNFDLAASILTRNSKIQLDKLIQLVKDHGFTEITLEGNADTLGTGKFDNVKLSEERSKSVGAYLDKALREYGVKIVYKAFGDTNPVADNNSKNGQALNRRVDISVK